MDKKIILCIGVLVLFSSLSRSPFTGNNLVIPPVSYPITSGCWTWFIDPRAVRYNGNTYFGLVDNLGNVKIASFADGEAVNTITTLKPTLEVDDHDNPSILIRDSDKKILAFYSKHDNTVMYLRVSSSAEDISSFAAEQALAASIGAVKYTYPNPVQLLSETNYPIYLFYRDRDGSNNALWAYSKSEDGGATWAARTTLFGQDTSAYLRFASDGAGRIDFAASTHPLYDTADKLWHFYYSGGNYYQTDGTQIVSGLPFSGADLTEVYDSGTDQVWIWDIARDGGGNLAMVSVQMETDYSDHRYYYSRWNGSSWDTNMILDTGAGSFSPAAGEATYAGGIVLDPDDVDTVYLSRPVNGIFEIWKYTTVDSGANWTGIAITQNSKQHNARPVVIRGNGAGSRKLLWWEGIYPSYTTYKTYIRAGDG